MTIKKSGIKKNPLLQKTEEAIVAENNETIMHDDMSANNHVNKKTNNQENKQSRKQPLEDRLRRKTFYLEEETFELLRRYAFEKREKMYKVVNRALKEYIKSQTEESRQAQ